MCVACEVDSRKATGHETVESRIAGSVGAAASKKKVKPGEHLQSIDGGCSAANVGKSDGGGSPVIRSLPAQIAEGHVAVDKIEA